MPGPDASQYLLGPAPRAFAHRGWHVGDLAGCENSLAAFRRAVDEGYTYLETDVHATADGRLIAFHDHFLDRVTDRRGRVAGLTWDQIRPARISGREPIPLLAELLEALPDARFNIDPKAHSAIGPLLDVIKTSGVGPRIGLGSFSDRRLTALRTALGEDVVQSLGPRRVMALVGAATLGRPFVPLPAERAAQVPVAYGRVPVVTPRTLACAHAAGLEVHVWTIDDPDEMRRLLDLGVDGIMTDRPDRLRAVLVERGEWRA